MDLQTLLVNPPRSDGESTGASSTPIYQSATFAVSEGGRWDYSRTGNPTREVLERQLALLDGGEYAFAYNSGVAALAAIFRLVPRGGRIACATDVYGGTFRLLDLLSVDNHWDVRYVNVSDEADLERIATARPDLFFVEIPSNPLLMGSDIPGIRAILGDDVLMVVDHSMLSPVAYRPLAHGADVAVQSGTKLLGGHGDLTAGVVCTSNGPVAEKLRFRQNAEGTALAPFDSWLLIRGLQTLPLRLERQVATTRDIVRVLRQHAVVKKVYYPDREDQQCPVVSVSTGSIDLSRAITNATRLFRTTVSFGSVFSSISLPCEMSHASIPTHLHSVSNLPRDLVRVSVGIEAASDLLNDLGLALDIALAGSAAAGAASNHVSSAAALA